MTDLLEVDAQIYQSLSELERHRIADELIALGVMLSDCIRLYTDEVGRVVGAVRTARDEDGNKLYDGATVLVENVGIVP